MRVTAAVRRAGPHPAPSVLTMNFIYLAAAVTLAGVPAGLALTGGNTPTVMTVSLAVSPAGLVLAGRRWPRAVLLVASTALAYGIVRDRLVEERVRIAHDLMQVSLTAKTHITRAIAKLGVRDRVQVVIIAYEDGLV